MKRRTFITLLGGAVVWPRCAHAQQPVRTIGLLGSGSAAAQSQWTAAFVARLAELGWAEGRNLRIVYRWADGHNERYAEIASELVQSRVDLILTHNTVPTLAAKHATSAIPVVFATAGDPVGSGIVASLARPGGNVTGLSGQAPDTAGKRIQLLRELAPTLQRLAVFSEAGNPYAALDVKEFQAGARTLGVDVESFDIARGEDIDGAFRSLKGRVQAVYVLPIPLLFTHRAQINRMSLAARLPTMFVIREYVQAGGLISYGPNWVSMWRPAADLVGKILDGANPGDIPIEQPTKFDLVVNLKTAKDLDITVPDRLLAVADEVIE